MKSKVVFFLVILSFTFNACIKSSATKKNLKSSRPNVLLIVADDFSYESMSLVGGIAPDVTPNIDKLAKEGLAFENAFSTVSVCQPSRQSMLSGLIPLHYGGKGFFPMKEGIPTLPFLLGNSGYITGIIHKIHHLQPEKSFNWDFDNEKLGLMDPDGVVGRDPQAIARGLKNLISFSSDNNKPFFMMVGSADTHRPFHGDKINPNIPFWGNGLVDINIKEPSRIYKPEEVNVPAALPDIPDIRNDLAKYASSARRLDDTVGECLAVLRETNSENSTLVIFVSDNGMPLPFGKFDAYYGSNRSPFLMKWPGVIKKEQSNNSHLISLMDITPTVLELAGLPIPSPIDGKSLVPFIENKEPKNWRNSIVFIRNQDINYGDALEATMKKRPEYANQLVSEGWIPRPDHEVLGTYSRDKEIRTFYDGKYGYIYNNCFNENGLEIADLGVIVPYYGPSIKVLKNTSKFDNTVMKRYEHFLLRAPEELYDWSKDPGSNVNLVNNPDYIAVLKNARMGLLKYMKASKDPLKEVYEDLIK